MGGFNTGSGSGTNVGVGMNTSFGEGGGSSEAVFEPTAQQLNKFLIAQLQGMIASTLEPLGAAPTKPTAPPKGATQAQKKAYQQDLKEYNQELKAYNQEVKARGALTKSPLQRGGLVPFMRDMSEFTTPGEEERSYLRRIQDLANAPRVGPEEQLGLDAITRAMDPTGSVAAAKDTLAQIVAPTLRNTLAASGMGRSGAQGEALAREGTALTLPIMEAVRGAQLSGGAKLLDYGQAIDQRQAGRVLSALEAARIPRDALMQEKLRPAQLLAGMMGRLPAGVGVGTNASNFSQQIATGLNLSSGQQTQHSTGAQLGKG